jgi:mannose-6-phosphate isomerase-like protein (cupin superfamily)
VGSGGAGGDGAMPRVVKKGWGREEIFADHPDYAGKLLVFDRPGAKMSMHFHRTKDETWYVLKGIFALTVHSLSDAAQTSRRLEEGDVWRNEAFVPHRLECLSESGTIVEVSTYDDPADNYRIAPGDSQRA